MHPAPRRPCLLLCAAVACCAMRTAPLPAASGARSARSPARAAVARTSVRLTAPTQTSGGSSGGANAASSERAREGSTAGAYKLGIMLLGQGAPESSVDLESYLQNIFEDPEVVTVPDSLPWAKRPLAWAIARQSARGLKKTTEGLLDAVSVSESAQLQIVRDQASALEAALRRREVSAQTFVAMRYWTPYIADAVEEIKAAGVTHLLILPLFPQFSLATSGSSLRVLEDTLDSDVGFSAIKNVVIPSWYKQPAYVNAVAQGVVRAVERLGGGGGEGEGQGAPAGEQAASSPRPRRGPFARLFGRGGGSGGSRQAQRAGPRLPTLRKPAASAPPTILFSCVSLPEKYVTDLGDPYIEQIELTVSLVMARVQELSGSALPHSIAYQGQLAEPSVPNRIRWVGPNVEDEITRLGGAGVRALVVVPLSFLFEQRGTLYMQDKVYRELAAQNGISEYERAPTLGADAELIEALAGAVEGALPSLLETKNPLENAVDMGIPMHLTIVNDLLQIQQKGEGMRLVPQEQPWGIKDPGQAELVNGRVAMAALVVMVSQGLIVDSFFPNLWRELLEGTLAFLSALTAGGGDGPGAGV